MVLHPKVDLLRNPQKPMFQKKNVQHFFPPFFFKIKTSQAYLCPQKPSLALLRHAWLEAIARAVAERLAPEPGQTAGRAVLEQRLLQKRSYIISFPRRNKGRVLKQAYYKSNSKLPGPKRLKLLEKENSAFRDHSLHRSTPDHPVWVLLGAFRYNETNQLKPTKLGDPQSKARDWIPSHIEFTGFPLDLHAVEAHATLGVLRESPLKADLRKEFNHKWRNGTD